MRGREKCLDTPAISPKAKEESLGGHFVSSQQASLPTQPILEQLWQGEDSARPQVLAYVEAPWYLTTAMAETSLGHSYKSPEWAA